MNKSLIIILLVLGAVGTAVYATQGKDSKESRSHAVKAGQAQYNICLLLDLSDRIDPRKDPLQAEKDQKVIAGVVEQMGDVVKRKLYVNSRDVLRVAVAPQPNDYRETLMELGDNLAIDMRELKVIEKREKFPGMKKQFAEQVSLLYGAAVKNSKFTGSDIWSFFRDDLEKYRVEGSETQPVRNILVILTDGYITFNGQSSRPREKNRTSYTQVGAFRHGGWEREFDSRDYGLIPAGKNHEGWEVLVLEADPKTPRDFPVISKYWSKWFEEMGISRYRIEKENDSAKLAREVVADFIKPPEKPAEALKGVNHGTSIP